MIKIGVFEDHPIVTNSLKQILTSENNISLVFTSSTKLDFYEFLNNNKDIDIVTIDYLAEKIVGTELFEHVLKNYPSIKIIAFTSLSSPILIDNLLSLGVFAYVNKDQHVNDLLEAINHVYKGQKYIHSDYSFILSKYEKSETKQLTAREIEIVSLILREFSSKDIGEFLGISVNTVESHRKQILLKLNVKNVAGMVRESITLGYI